MDPRCVRNDNPNLRAVVGVVVRRLRFAPKVECEFPRCARKNNSGRVLRGGAVVMEQAG